MELFINQCVLDCSNPRIMGILNVSPDSFFDGGKYCDLSKAIDHVSYMITHGATFIDVGGESTRPGFKQITSEEEVDRVVPVIYEISKRFDTFISVNTSSALVIKECVKIGRIHLINDVRSLTNEGAMHAAACCELPICLVHNLFGVNHVIHEDIPKDTNIINEVNNYFIRYISRCESAGIRRNRLLIDPGFGFGKSLIHNYQLLSQLKFFKHFGLPILIGISRKSMLGMNDSNKFDANKRLIGSITSAVIAAMQDVHIIRVHDVKETAEALQVVNIVRSQQKK